MRRLTCGMMTLLGLSLGFGSAILCVSDGAVEPRAAVVAASAAGRFGKAFRGDPDGRRWLEVEANAAFGETPLTVECWAQVNRRDRFNVLVANESKISGTHWELYSFAGTGSFSVYMPGYSPAEIQSERDIADGKWHGLAMTFDGREVTLYVDGAGVISKEVTRNAAEESLPGPLTIGLASEPAGRVGLDGLVDEIRISRGIRRIQGVPDEPFEADAETVGLWRLDESDETGTFRDSSNGNPAVFRMYAAEEGSMDELEKAAFHPGPSPMDAKPDVVALEPGPAGHPEGARIVPLDGEWEMAEGGDETERLAGKWSDAIVAAVPGSVHAALWKAGRIPNPYVGKQDAAARENSFKTWWFCRTFPRPRGTQGEALAFGGVAIRCTVWLNGRKLGTHEGMFGGPVFDVRKNLEETNTLIVRIDPAPFAPGGFAQSNAGWRETVVFNCVYGWHYSDIPALGIWRSVTIRSAPTVAMDHPFVAARDAPGGVVDLQTRLRGPDNGWSGTLVGTIRPDNFTGSAHHFKVPVASTLASKDVRLRFTVPDPRLWWPVDVGEPNRYRLRLSFVPDGGGVADTQQVPFGIRTIRMAPLPGGPRPDTYNWTFVINGKPMFVKGANWCTMDPLMDFSRERIDRLLTLAASQHIQLLRAWGSGMPETDEFYDLADRHGIMVLQEWPTAWDSHKTQPYEMLEETVRLNMLRLRNHPSLVMWGGGNESGQPYGKAIDMMGRYSTELDGTRPFHRAEPWGGSRHDYSCDWGRAPLDVVLHLTAAFFGEFGMFSCPHDESVQRYLPPEERDRWPAPDDGSFAYHTPVFNKMGDLERLRIFSGYFTAGDTMEEFIVGSQLAACTAVRHTLERARTRWPDCTGALYYKLNDNYPAASWASVDWYGAPKMTHFFNMDAFAPLHAVPQFQTFDNFGKPLSLPIVLLDDADALAGASWQVAVRAYDGKLKRISQQVFPGRGSIGSGVKNLGEFELTAAQTGTEPLLLVVEVRKDGVLADRTFYWTNFLSAKGCLFRLPRTRVTMVAGDGTVVVTNGGDVPAVGVSLSRPGHGDTFFARDNFFWLEPGESYTVSVNTTEGLKLGAWNAED